MEALRLSVFTRCPGGPGCKCQEHWGLGDFMLSATGTDHGLPRLEAAQTGQKVTLRPVDACDGSFTCDCPSCAQERSERVKHPPKEPRQPWMPKAA
jgi:hypothetical protein